jgi:hypothetical protein
VHPLDVHSRSILSRELAESRRAAAARGPGARATVGKWLVSAGRRLAPDAVVPCPPEVAERPAAG